MLRDERAQQGKEGRLASLAVTDGHAAAADRPSCLVETSQVSAILSRQQNSHKATAPRVPSSAVTIFVCHKRERENYWRYVKCTTIDRLISGRRPRPISAAVGLVCVPLRRRRRPPDHRSPTDRPPAERKRYARVQHLIRCCAKDTMRLSTTARCVCRTAEPTMTDTSYCRMRTKTQQHHHVHAHHLNDSKDNRCKIQAGDPMR